MSTVERLKIAIEEVALVRTGCALEWKETLDEKARTLAVGFVSDAEAHTLGRKLKDVDELAWDREQELLVREARSRGQDLNPQPCPPELVAPLTPELVDSYRLQILKALLREGAVNTKF
jgi:hypothetical protein